MEEMRQERRKPDEDKHRVLLEEKYFRRMEVFEGDRSKFRNWVFDFLVQVGIVDKGLARELKKLTMKINEDKWNPEGDPEVD